MLLREVMFHTGVADVPGHVARLAAKVLRSGETMVVLCAAQEVDAIDTALWALDKTGFLPHSHPGSSAFVQVRSPIAVVSSLQGLGPDVSKRLVSTTHAWVDGCEAFEKLIEVVSPQGKADARQRWMRFAHMGVTLSNTALDK